jgi:hypothetical protein
MPKRREILGRTRAKNVTSPSQRLASRDLRSQLPQKNAFAQVPQLLKD